MPTQLKFLSDPYACECRATIVAIEMERIILDRTVFYPATGMMPADSGELFLTDGRVVPIAESVWLERADRRLAHVSRDRVARLSVGHTVNVGIRWLPRFRRMRLHTALHLISISLPYDMIDGAVDEQEGYVEFEMDDTGMDRHWLERYISRLVNSSLPVTSCWIPKPLVNSRPRVQSFNWPESGGHFVRGVQIGNNYVQPCDGLHVRNTAEVGGIKVLGFERISSSCRRVRIALADVG
jgi:misacylated tRNA(Ala) deacylase